MFIACSTLCFARYPLERVLRTIDELEFSKVEIAISEKGPHLKPSQVMQDVQLAALQTRIGPSLTPSAFRVEIDAPDPVEFQKQLRALCRLARLTSVSTITLPAAENAAPFEQEVIRLKRLVQLAQSEGIVLSVPTWIGTMTETPEMADQLCREVPGLRLTLDPSHYLIGPNKGESYDRVYEHVCHVHLRDTGPRPDQFQVQVGQGQIEYGRIISQLNRQGYDRLLTVEIQDIPDVPFVMESEVRKLKYLLESLI